MSADQLREAIIRGEYSVIRWRDGRYDLCIEKGEIWMTDEEASRISSPFPSVGVTKGEFFSMTVAELRQAVIRSGRTVFRRHDGSYDLTDDSAEAPWDDNPPPRFYPDDYWEGGTEKLDPEYMMTEILVANVRAHIAGFPGIDEETRARWMKMADDAARPSELEPLAEEQNQLGDAELKNYLRFARELCERTVGEF